MIVTDDAHLRHHPRRESGHEWRWPLGGPAVWLVATLTAAILAASCVGRGSDVDTVVIGTPYELRTLDPHVDDTLSAYAALGSLYEPLVTTDADLRNRPCLAESWANPDALTWVLRLRPGVRFHSGRPLRARDVVYSIERPLGGRDTGVRRHLAEVASVLERGPLAVEIRTRVPDPVFLNRLRFLYVVPEGAGEDWLSRNADGTGPFALDRWTPTSSLSLVRHERYWGARAALRRVEYRLGLNPEDALRGLLEGRYLLVQASPPSLAAAVGRFAVRRRDSLYLKFLAFDISRDVTPYVSLRPNPFKDLRVRRAIHLAIDRRELAASLRGDAVPASQVVPSLVFGFNPRIPEPRPDLHRARDLMREAGIASGFSTVLLTRRILAEPGGLLKTFLARIGISVELEVVSDAEFYEALNRRDASLWLERYGCGTADAGEALGNLLHSKDEPRHLGIDNDTGLALPDLDRAIEESTAIEDVGERQAALQSILKRAADDLLLIPLYSDSDTYLMDPSLSWAPRADSYIRAQDIGRDVP